MCGIEFVQLTKNSPPVQTCYRHMQTCSSHHVSFSSLVYSILGMELPLHVGIKMRERERESASLSLLFVDFSCICYFLFSCFVHFIGESLQNYFTNSPSSQLSLCLTGCSDSRWSISLLKKSLSNSETCCGNQILPLLCSIPSQIYPLRAHKNQESNSHLLQRSHFFCRQTLERGRF